MESTEAAIPEELNVGRGDPVYMAHAYLTKVPVPAITPFIAVHTEPGAIVADPFAGSGMTGVAAAILGRGARLSDISVLGQHIGSNYVNLVDSDILRKVADEVIRGSRARLGPVYEVTCQSCGQAGELAKTVWSFVVACPGCGAPQNYYRSLEQASWNKSSMTCSACGAQLTSRAERVGEEAVLDYVVSACSKTQLTQDSGEAPDVTLDGLEIPAVEIGPDRQMYRASALGKSGLITVASYYSRRNLAALAALRDEIDKVEDVRIRRKLLFAFTASLTRASKRYQWSRQRPLNAANANYYVAPVFYEWNVYDLFTRKVDSVANSDSAIREQRRQYVPEDRVDAPDVTYEIASADALPWADQSVDYIFTDPPFGSNLFYSDMALFHEGWLGRFTAADQEAVIDRSRDGKRSAERYETLLRKALTECHRVLRPGGKVSMVFGNSSGKVWALVQRAIAAAGFAILPDQLIVLNKGQRSVKGLASGFEHVATLDLIITMQAVGEDAAARRLHHPDDAALVAAVRSLEKAGAASTPSHLYLELLRHALRNEWSVADLDLRKVTATLIGDGWKVDAKSGKLVSAAAPSSQTIRSG